MKCSEDVFYRVVDILYRDLDLCLTLYNIEDDKRRRETCSLTTYNIYLFLYRQSTSRSSMPIRIRNTFDEDISGLMKMIRMDYKELIGLCVTVRGPFTRDPLFPKYWRSLKDSYAHLCGVYADYRSDHDMGYHRH